MDMKRGGNGGGSGPGAGEGGPGPLQMVITSTPLNPVHWWKTT